MTPQEIFATLAPRTAPHILRAIPDTKNPLTRRVSLLTTRAYERARITTFPAQSRDDNAVWLSARTRA